MRRWPLIGLVAIGLALIAAPAVFRMFERAPAGGQMLREFRPYMSIRKLSTFKADIDEIGKARSEIVANVDSLTGLDKDRFMTQFPQTYAFNADWPRISSDMGSMIEDIRSNIPNFDAVDSLPPFVLFPWFFVVPGLLIASLGVSVLISNRSGKGAHKRRIIIGLIGLGLVAAPAVFQMFDRAPKGARMIKAFEPIMTSPNVQKVQLYFLTIAGGEGDIRNNLVPLIKQRHPDQEINNFIPATSGFQRDFPTIAADMAPMIGAMSDNLDNFAAVHALPPFGLFPWFFVLPGLMVPALAFAARERRLEVG